MTLAMLDRLQPLEMSLGSDPSLLDAELVATITTAVAAHPRSRQKALGPSELGTPCLRKIGYKLADVEPVNAGGGSRWLPTIGTAVHAWLAEAFVLANADLGFVRYLIEQQVEVGVVAGQPIRGHADLYDRVTATVVDWKVVGPNRLKRARGAGGADPLGAQYRAQAHLYGLGFIARGVPVERVGVMFLPRNGELTERVWVTEVFDPAIALNALAIAESTANGIAELGPDLLVYLPTAADYCGSCPFFQPFSQSIHVACAGHPEWASTARVSSGIIAE